MATRRDVRIRYSAEGGREVEDQARRIGDAGDRHLKRVAAATAPVNRGLLAVDTAARQARGGLESMASSLGPLGRFAVTLGPVGLAVGAVAGGFLALLRASAGASAEIAAVGDAADRLQIDPGLFERLGAALTISGQSDRGLEPALRTLQNRLGEAQNGAKEAQSVFAALGVTLGGDLATTFEQLADGFAGIEDPAQRAAAAQRIFGEQGGALLSILAQGGDGFRALTSEAEKLGHLYGGDLIRDSQRITAEFAAQDRLITTRLNQGLSGFTGLWLGLKSALADVALNLAGVLDRFRDIDSKSLRSLNGELSETVEKLRVTQDLLATRAGAGDTSSTRFGGLQSQEAALTARIREINDEIERRGAFTPPSTTFTDAVSTGGGAAAAAPVAKNDGLFDRQIAAAERQLQTLDQQVAAFGMVESAAAAYRVEQELLSAALQEYGVVTENSRSIARLYADDLRTTLDQLDALTRAQTQQAEEARRAERDTASLADTFTRFGQSLATGGDALRAVIGLLGEFAQQALSGNGLIGGGVNAALGQASGGLIGALFAPAGGAPSSSPLPTPRPRAGAAFGADFTVGGAGGFDSRMLRLPVTPGERVTVTPPGAAPGGGFDERAMARALGRAQPPRGSRFELSRASLAADLSAVLNRAGRLA